jgi:hypothetical protein
LAILLAATIPYLPFLSLPFISDSYLQVFLGRHYGPLSQWGELAGDVLYRSRATSIVFTYLVDSWAGPDPAIHRLAGIALHAANCLLVASLGFWPRIGWPVAVPAAVYFALSEAHQEAVVWVASLPELLVFFFSLLAILAWLRALTLRSGTWLTYSFLAYLLALLSKESGAIVPAVAGAIWWWERRDWRLPLAALAAMGGVAIAYALAIFASSETHLHLNDGTFSFRAPALVVLVKSSARLLFPWGWVSLAALTFLGIARRTLLTLSIAWMAIALLPYAFLTYMDRVPSRHTYLASLGLSLIVGAAFVALPRLSLRWGRPAAVVFAMVISVQSVYYLWTKKLDQYARRAEPTERFLQFVVESSSQPAAKAADDPIRIDCAPYGFEAFRYAAMIRLGTEKDFVVGPDSTSDSARPYCDPSRP